MKTNWFKYLVVGILFGVFDYFYQRFIVGMIYSDIISFIAVWGIWLVPIIPIALNEAKTSQSRLMSVLACILTWSISIITYYLIVPIRLIFIGQVSRQEVYIANYRDQFYFSNLKNIFLNDVLISIIEWIGVAIIGGGFIGFSVSCIYLRLKKLKIIEK